MDQARLKKALRQTALWLGGAVIAILAAPTTSLLAMIYGASALVDRLVGDAAKPI